MAAAIPKVRSPCFDPERGHLQLDLRDMQLPPFNLTFINLLGILFAHYQVCVLIADIARWLSR